MEDGQALADLIATRLREEDGREPLRPVGPEILGGPHVPRVPSAYENSRLAPEECLAKLESLGVAFAKPSFETPGVETPLLLKGPVAGVIVRPRWDRPKPENAVMDCHLALAVFDLAERARESGVTEILYYSAYRPLRRGDRPRNPSQHRAGLGLDVRWLVLRDGRTLDVLDDFERSDGAPPCEGEPTTHEGRLLRDLACGLYRDAIFNVILTPNANKAHHNHFHLDVTRGAKWHIVR